jgi:hypothetical protein
MVPFSLDSVHLTEVKSLTNISQIIVENGTLEMNLMNGGETGAQDFLLSAYSRIPLQPLFNRSSALFAAEVDVDRNHCEQNLCMTGKEYGEVVWLGKGNSSKEG